MPDVVNRGVRIHYDVQGTGPTVLLLAGLGYGGWYWRHVRARLSPHCTVVTVDNRGSDGSDKPAGPYTTALLAEDAAAVLDVLGRLSTTVVGHSLGGLIAQELALARPDLVGRLVLMSTHHGGWQAIPVTPAALAVMLDRSGSAQEVFQRGMAVATAPGFSTSHPELVEELRAYRAGGPVPASAYTAQLMAGAGHDAASRLSRISCDVLVLAGALDQVVPVGNVELLRKRMPHAVTHVFPRAGHLLGWEEIDDVSDQILRWVRAAS
ncbi:MAG: alpha/beta hydrolase [Myxococcota bacterium]